LLLFGAEPSPQQFRAGGIPCDFWNGFDLVGYFRLQHRWVRPCFVCCPGTMTDLFRSVMAGDLCLDAHLLGRVWIGTRDCQAKFWLLTSSTESVWIAAILPRFGLPIYVHTRTQFIFEPTQGGRFVRHVPMWPANGLAGLGRDSILILDLII